MAKYLTVDEFMTQGFDSETENDNSQGKKPKSKQKVKRKKSQADKNVKKKRKVKESQEHIQDNESDDDSGSAFDDHQSTLANLKDKDPDFYKYLSENDRDLLSFNLSGEEGSSDDDEEQDPIKNEKFHKPPQKLQVDSDESDLSENEDQEEAPKEKSKTKFRRTDVTVALLTEWRTTLETKPNVSTIKAVMLAFRAAVEQAGDESQASTSPFSVKGATAFNSVMKLCLTSLLPAVHKVLHLPPPNMSANQEKPDFDPKKSKSWPRLNTAIRSYLTDMIKMLSVMVETDIVSVLLRHILYWLPFYIKYPKHSRLLVKRLISFWSTSEETIRVLAFLGIIRVLRILPNSYLDYFLKQLYLSYVSNCKFTSPTTWPLINFMKRSMVELYSLDPNIAYQHAFVYIRQLAIHLRSALTTRKKDAFQVVYNWQFVHCILLWVHLLSTLHATPQLASLIFPLTQVILGVTNLIPTSRYLPLRFHMIRALTKLSADTETFIPVLPLIVQIFQIVDFNKRHSSVSLKPMDFSCALKLSKSQLQENAFRDGCVKQVYELLMDYLNTIYFLIGYPELIFPAVVQIKAFLKSCKVGNYCRQIKQAVDKMEENTRFISEKRKNVSFAVSDTKAVDEWQNKCKEEGTPFTKFYTSWRKLKDQEIVFGIAKKDKGKDEILPTIDRKKLKEMKKVDQEEFSELFASGSDDDENQAIGFLHAIDRTEKANQKKEGTPKGKPKKKKKKMS